MGWQNEHCQCHHHLHHLGPFFVAGLSVVHFIIRIYKTIVNFKKYKEKIKKKLTGHIVWALSHCC